MAVAGQPDVAFKAVGALRRSRACTHRWCVPAARPRRRDGRTDQWATPFTVPWPLGLQATWPGLARRQVRGTHRLGRPAAHSTIPPSRFTALSRPRVARNPTTCADGGRAGTSRRPAPRSGHRPIGPGSPSSAGGGRPAGDRRPTRRPHGRRGCTHPRVRRRHRCWVGARFESRTTEPHRHVGAAVRPRDRRGGWPRHPVADRDPDNICGLAARARSPTSGSRWPTVPASRRRPHRTTTAPDLGRSRS